MKPVSNFLKTHLSHTRAHRNDTGAPQPGRASRRSSESSAAIDAFAKTPPAPRLASASSSPTVLSVPPAAPSATSAASSPAATSLAAVPVVATTRTVRVGNDTELKTALAAARSGDNICLQAGFYAGPLALSGKTGVTLSGNSDAVITTTSTTKPNVSVADCTDCTFAGLTLKGGQKGIMATNNHNVVFDHLDVSGTQMEGVHIKDNSSNVTLQKSSVHDTGLGGTTPAGNGRVQSDDGEGIYVGTAKSNNPSGDPTHTIKILDNTVYNTTAENIDIKEFTRDGIISGNTLDGRGCGEGAAANVEIKGSGWKVTGNTVTHAWKTGIKNYAVSGVPDSGTDNTISNNSIS